MEPKIFSTAERAEQMAHGEIVTTFEHLSAEAVVEAPVEEPPFAPELTPSDSFPAEAPPPEFNPELPPEQ